MNVLTKGALAEFGLHQHAEDHVSDCEIRYGGTDDAAAPAKSLPRTIGKA